jgi:hypothetical protein
MNDNNGLALRGMDEIERAATAMQKSGYFQDARDVAQCVTKVLAGREMGFGPFASMTGIFIIQGRPSIGANLMAAAVKRSGRYNYRVLEMSDTVCEIVFFEEGKECGRSRFTLDDAKKAKTKNMEAFPRNMLFARAMSNGCRWYCPDVFSGAPTYTPEELGANVNEAGEVIDIAPLQPDPVTFTKVIPPPAVTVTPREAEIIGELIPEEQPAPSTIDAWKMTEDTHTPYADIDSTKLTFRLNSIVKRTPKLPDDPKRIEYLRGILQTRHEAENK